jgi:hypothetical protein
MVKDCKEGKKKQKEEIWYATHDYNTRFKIPKHQSRQDAMDLKQRKDDATIIKNLIDGVWLNNNVKSGGGFCSCNYQDYELDAMRRCLKIKL